MCKCLSAGPAADVLLVRQAVAAEMGNRTAQQVQHYYRDNVQALKKGPWAADEDAALLKVRHLLCAGMDCCINAIAVKQAALQTAVGKVETSCYTH
jgi:hypothetical protein